MLRVVDCFDTDSSTRVQNYWLYLRSEARCGLSGDDDAWMHAGGGRRKNSTGVGSISDML